MPTGSPAATRSPGSTAMAARYEKLTRTAPPATVTERIPATDPANVTHPGTGLVTWDPGSAGTSIPQCPA